MAFCFLWLVYMSNLPQCEQKRTTSCSIHLPLGRWIGGRWTPPLFLPCTKSSVFQMVLETGPSGLLVALHFTFCSNWFLTAVARLPSSLWSLLAASAALFFLKKNKFTSGAVKSWGVCVCFFASSWTEQRLTFTSFVKRGKLTRVLLSFPSNSSENVRY